MAYLSIQDFRYGMDRRRERVAGTPGTLWTLENAHITRGGDIERCKSFVSKYSLTAGTRGLFALNRQLYVFGSANLAGSMPLGVAYQRLQGPGAQVLTSIVDVKGFAGKVYAIADFDDGSRFHFYDGSRVTDWDTIAASAATYKTLAQFLAEKINADPAVSAEATDQVIRITARVPGTAFTIAGAAVNNGADNTQSITIATPQANVAPVAEVQAHVDITINGGTTGQISSVTLGATQLIANPVVYNATPEATAIRLAQAITSLSATSHYSASVVGNVVTIKAAVGTGATPNGTALAVVTAGDIAVTPGASLAGGVTAVTAVAQISTATFGGTFEAADAFSVTINGTDYKATGLASATGKSLHIAWQRVWSPANSLWNYCKLKDATVWNPATVGSDAGFLNVSLDDDGNQNLTVAARYQTYDAIYSETAVVLYQLDTDPANFNRYLVLDNTSTEAQGSVTRYGNNDVFHLDPTGVRSLRALNSSNAPFVSDVGNAIDTFVLDFLDTLTSLQRRNAKSAIEPRDGRYMLAVGSRIFVLSFFPGAKISGWSYYSPGFEVEAFAKIGKQLFLRAGNTIYLYGGDSGSVYPADNELPVTVELPFLSANAPATRKGLDGFDAAFTNEWDVNVLVAPNDETQKIAVGKVVNRTYGSADIALPGETSMVALEFVCNSGGRATVSMAQIHFEKADEG